MLVLFGLAVTALGVVMFAEGDLDTSAETGLAVLVLAVGLLNVSAPVLSRRVPRIGVVTGVVDALFLALVYYLVSQMSIG